MKFEINQIKRGQYAGQWRFAIVADNGEKIDPRQPYNNKKDVLHAVYLIRQMAEAPLIMIQDDLSKPKKSSKVAKND